jgi:DNA-binding XRE family transcriptional regulator
VYSKMGQHGLEIIRSGKLRQLRKELDLTQNHMAMLLYVSPVTYKVWESRGAVGATGKMWNSAAEKVARFYDAATVQLQQARDSGFVLAKMLPLHMAATVLGMPQDLLFRACRVGRVSTMDLGVLGTWVYRAELDEVDLS